MASSSYASHTDVLGTSGYLRDPNSAANQSIIDTLCNVASGLIDETCGGGGSQFFYDDGYYKQDFDSQGQAHIDPRRPFFFSSGTIASCIKGATSLTYTASALAPNAPQNGDSLTLDTASVRETVTINGAVTGTNPYTLPITATTFAHGTATLATTLQVELRYFENQPESQAILTLDGNGINSPSNFFVWPRERPRVRASNQSTADTTSRWPWYGIDISHIPISNTTFLPSSIPGYMTVGVTAHWGWPVVPVLIKDLTIRAVSLAWRARGAGQSGDSGTAGLPNSAISQMRKLIDAELKDSDFRRRYI